MKIKKTDDQLIYSFWASPPEAIFNVKTIALVLDMSESWLQKLRTDGKGPKYDKMLNTTIFYRKKDIVEFLDGVEK
jgi:hypothetical protein